MTEQTRDLRQQTLLPPDRLAGITALVIGVGSIGRRVALELAAMGVPKLWLVDHDVVETVNLATQLWQEADLGCAKVIAAAATCKLNNPACQVVPLQSRFQRSMLSVFEHDELAVFVCVDSIDVRTFIWEHTHRRASFLVDGRTGGEVCRVITSGQPATDTHYQTTLFPGREAYSAGCTPPGAGYTAMAPVVLMLNQFSRWLRALPLRADMTLDLASLDLILEDTMYTRD